MSYLSPSLFYFMFFGGMSFLMPFLALFYQQAGYDGYEIGLLAGIAPLITLVGGPFWAGVADSSRRHKLVMAFAMLTTITCVLLIPRTSQFFSLFMLVVLFAFLGAPIVSLADSATIWMLGEKKNQYGKIRLWGAVGWGLFAPVAGVVVERSGMDWPFYGYAIGMSLALIFALGLRFPSQQQTVQFRTGFKTLLTSRQWIFFLGIVLVCGLGMASINNYLFIYMESLGMSKTLMGLALTVSTLSEIPVMFFANRFLQRFRPQKLLLLALVVIGTRLLLYTAFTADWQILLVQLLHGFTYPLIWVAGVAYANQVAPPGLSATAQGMFGSTLMGVGAALGGLVGGLLLQQGSPTTMYLVIGLGLVISAAAFSLAQPRFDNDKKS